MKLIPKIVLSILITASLFFGGFITLVIVALGGALVFQQVLVVAAFIVLWLFLLMQIWNLLRAKVRYISLAVMVGVIAVSAVGFEINKAYHDSIEQINEQGVNLSLYDPFRENTLAVALD